jgi:thiamine kinase-like enzyme
MLMLTKNELKEIMHFFNLEFTPDSLKPLAGGDVNKTYLAVDGSSRYAVKKIDLHQYKKNYNVSVEEIIESAIFCEAITKQLTSTEHAVSAIEGKQSCVLTIDKSIIMVYPYINGKPLENCEISLSEVTKISKLLKKIHHWPINYDVNFAKTKLAVYQQIGSKLLNHTLWSFLKKVTTKKYLFPKLNLVCDFLIHEKPSLSDAVLNLNGDTICHNDLKPKNILWETEDKFFVIDWETLGLFDKMADYIDTLLSWCTTYDTNTVTLNKQKLVTFIDNYSEIDCKNFQSSAFIVFIKWYFWLAFCIKQILSKPLNFKHYLWHVNYSINFIIFLINDKPMDIIKTTLEAKAANA